MSARENARITARAGRLCATFRKRCSIEIVSLVSLLQFSSTESRISQIGAKHENMKNSPTLCRSPFRSEKIGIVILSRSTGKRQVPVLSLRVSISQIILQLAACFHSRCRINITFSLPCAPRLEIRLARSRAKDRSPRSTMLIRYSDMIERWPTRQTGVHQERAHCPSMQGTREKSPRWVSRVNRCYGIPVYWRSHGGRGVPADSPCTVARGPLHACKQLIDVPLTRFPPLGARNGNYTP